MRCESATRYLDAFRTGELDQKHSRMISRHLSRCEDCSREVAGLEQLALQASRMRTRAPGTILESVLEKTEDSYGELETEIGRVRVGFNARGITMIAPVVSDSESFQKTYLLRRGRSIRRAELPRQYADAVRRAAAGETYPAASVDLAGLPEFERQVLLLLRSIPRGEVRPYAWLAREAGRPKAVRAVGTTMARNPVPFLLPCHRVVPAGGGIGNYAFGSELKRELLRREGAPVNEMEQLAQKGVRFIGCRTTGIYCFPSCHHARRIRPENRVPLANARQAASAGYRPCLGCRPASLAS
jgi:O-6-methylguanine DNA methyltransferase